MKLQIIERDCAEVRKRNYILQHQTKASERNVSETSKTLQESQQALQEKDEGLQKWGQELKLTLEGLSASKDGCKTFSRVNSFMSEENQVLTDKAAKELWGSGGHETPRWRSAASSCSRSAQSFSPTTTSCKTPERGLNQRSCEIREKLVTTSKNKTSLLAKKRRSSKRLSWLSESLKTTAQSCIRWSPPWPWKKKWCSWVRNRTLKTMFDLAPKQGVKNKELPLQTESSLLRGSSWCSCSELCQMRPALKLQTRTSNRQRVWTTFRQSLLNDPLTQTSRVQSETGWIRETLWTMYQANTTLGTRSHRGVWVFQPFSVQPAHFSWGQTFTVNITIFFSAGSLWPSPVSLLMEFTDDRSVWGLSWESLVFWLIALFNSFVFTSPISLFIKTKDDLCFFVWFGNYMFCWLLLLPACFLNWQGSTSLWFLDRLRTFANCLSVVNFLSVRLCKVHFCPPANFLDQHGWKMLVIFEIKIKRSQIKKAWWYVAPCCFQTVEQVDFAHQVGRLASRFKIFSSKTHFGF